MNTKFDFTIKVQKIDMDNMKIYYTINDVNFNSKILKNSKGYYFEIDKCRYNLEGKLIRVNGLVEYINGEAVPLNKKHILKGD